MSIVARGLGSPRTGSLVMSGLGVTTPSALAQAGRVCLALLAASVVLTFVGCA